MKKLLSLFLFWSMILIPINLFSQSFCESSANHEINEILDNSIYRDANIPNYKFCVRIYIHVVRRDDKSGGQTPSQVNTAISFLDTAYNPYGIYFRRIGGINYINSTSIFNHPNSIFSTTIYDHSDGVDIYLFDDNTNGLFGYGWGYAGLVGETTSKLLVTGSWTDGSSMVRSHVLSHEMGHVLSLFHTHHGTFDACAECANGSNGYICGDYIADTPADPNMGLQVTPISCQWTGSGTDSCIPSTFYNPDELNIMSYTIPPCMSNITPKQAHRAKLALLSVSYLQAASTYTINGSNPCPSFAGGFLVYPNPADNIVHLDLTENPEGQYFYRLLNFQGELFREGMISNEIMEINISNMNSGLYVMQVNFGEETLSKNLIIL